MSNRIAIAAKLWAIAMVAMLTSHDDPPRPIPIDACAVEVLFSPRGGVTERVVREIDCATSTIEVQAYSFTSKPIADALIRAKERGVDVDVCADDSNKNPLHSIADELKRARISVLLDSKHAIAHSKTIVIDAHLVITGSFNWTAAAETANLENCLFIDSKPLASRYHENFLIHSGHCVRL